MASNVKVVGWVVVNLKDLAVVCSGSAVGVLVPLWSKQNKTNKQINKHHQTNKHTNKQKQVTTLLYLSLMNWLKMHGAVPTLIDYAPIPDSTCRGWDSSIADQIIYRKKIPMTITVFNSANLQGLKAIQRDLTWDEK